MKILLVGQFKKWAIENHYARYLRKHADVYIYPAEEVFDDFYWASNWNKIKFKLGLTNILEKIADELVQRTAAIKPDVVLIFKGMRIVPKAIVALKGMGVKIANYNPDHPFMFSTKGSGNNNVTDCIPLYDLHFSYNQEVINRIAQEYSIPTAFLPFAYELSDKLFQEIKKEAEIKKACFIGNPDKIRTENILRLANHGIPVDVYGQNWQKYLSAKNGITLNDAVYSDEFWKTMYRYRLQLNIFRPHNIGSHNMRTFEVPAAGGIMLAPDSPEHRQFFAVGKEIFIYQNKTDLVEKAKYILSLSDEDALAIRKNARHKSLEGGYSYENRARQVFTALQKIIPAEAAALKT